jgi:hypothetical protein
LFHSHRRLLQIGYAYLNLSSLEGLRYRGFRLDPMSVDLLIVDTNRVPLTSFRWRAAPQFSRTTLFRRAMPQAAWIGHKGLRQSRENPAAFRRNRISAVAIGAAARPDELVAHRRDPPRRRHAQDAGESLSELIRLALAAGLSLRADGRA